MAFAESMKPEILVLAGTRPEIIKMAPLVRELRARAGESFSVHFCFSGQHEELAFPFFRYFGVEPDSRLNLMAPGQSLGRLTANAASQFDDFFRSRGAARAVLVQGDTTTAFMAALSAFYHRIPVGHVEAGLRTRSIDEPFPEELNRRLITRIARWHFAPTERAAATLRGEGVPAGDVLVTGNTGIDSLVWARDKNEVPAEPALAKLGSARLVLVTAHRRENLGEPLEQILRALGRLASAHPAVQFVWPLHKNPRLAEPARKALSGVANVHLTEPLGYGDLVWAMNRAELILSDSGGIQEEAPSLRKPVLVLRNETERPEAVELGTSILVGTGESQIFEIAHAFLAGSRSLSLRNAENPYGDGKASGRIVDFLTEHLIRG